MTIETSIMGDALNFEVPKQFEKYYLPAQVKSYSITNRKFISLMPHVVRHNLGSRVDWI